MENKTGKYLKYAFGEIVLVVIGILIALQINTWNEGRKQKAEEVNILKELKRDLETDLNNYKVNIERLEKRNEFSNNMYTLLSTLPAKKIDSSEVARQLLTIGYIENHRPSFATYSEIQGSGKLSIITSDSLKRELATYKSLIVSYYDIDAQSDLDLKDYERLISFHINGKIKPQRLFFPPEESNKYLTFDLQSISEDIELMKLLKYTTVFTPIQIVSRKYLYLEKINTILQLINQELNDD